MLNATDVERTADFFSRLGFEVRRGEQRCELLAGAFKIYFLKKLKFTLP